MSGAGEAVGKREGRPGNAGGREVHRYDEVTSTNDVALELAALGRPEGTVVIADRQLRGRGRRGRIWHSPGGGNLYLSMLLRPARDLIQWQQLSWVIAGAVALTVMERGVGEGLSLKCPNDLLVKGRKISGVLLENRTGSGLAPAVVAGIGLNVNLVGEEFPEALAGRATSLAMESGRSHDREKIAHLLCSHAWELYGLWNSLGAGHVRGLLEGRGVDFANFSEQGRCREESDPAAGRQE